MFLGAPGAFIRLLKTLTKFFEFSDIRYFTENRPKKPFFYIDPMFLNV